MYKDRGTRLTLGRGASVPSGRSVKVACDEGYHLGDASRFRRCDHGQWTGLEEAGLPICTESK